ncbi:UNVERIFIED_CONTAM: hypothetical protein K2H54_058284 [Gekko kuhli]
MALGKAKARKHTAEDPGTLGAPSPAKQTRSVAHKQELQTLYAWLAQLQDSEDEENAQSLTGGETLIDQLRPTLDPSLPWDWEHQQLWSRCLDSAGFVAGKYLDSGHMVVRSQAEAI